MITGAKMTSTVSGANNNDVAHETPHIRHVLINEKQKQT